MKAISNGRPTLGRRRKRGANSESPPRESTGSKLGQILGMLARPGGASIAALATATGWQPHSVRGALAGSLKRKGHVIQSEKTEGERRYRIGAAK
jgi:hypothetical protein